MIKIYLLMLYKIKNLELLENLKKWFNFKYDVIYFYNVYGPRQISKENVNGIGIFEEAYKNGKPLPVVRPGTQTRRFTHIKIRLIFVILHGKKIYQDIIAFPINKVFQFLK